MSGWDTATAHYSLSGAAMLGFFVAALFFLRFWKRTRDRLFLWFAVSFGVMGVQRAANLFAPHLDERTELALYGLRLLAFVVILAAILDKNRSTNKAALPPASGGSGTPKQRDSRPVVKMGRRPTTPNIVSE